VSQLPSGTVTFLLSDIEGSTRRWQENETAMRDALARHDGIIRAAVRVHSGHVLKHTGDGVLAVFAGAANAIAAAVQAQRDLQGADWGPLSLAVRMAIHSGETHERDGDYFGPTVNRVARLLAAAHGEQILISSAAAALAVDRPADDIDLVDVGEHRLRDLDRPERVLQACSAGLRRDFPPLRAAASELRGFPATRTKIIGRERLLARVAELLRSASLVTLTGVGGSGKTRLAIEAGRREGMRFLDGAAFVDLAPLGEPDLIARTVANSAGVPDSGTAGSTAERSAADDLVAYLTRRHMLVVLDNCEHLIDGCAELVDRLLAACPHVRVLATSRESLTVEGEATLTVPPLELPNKDRPPLDSGAVQLFVERADAARAGLDLLGHHLAAVVDICRRLDGIPLAIELAAGQVVHLTPEEVITRLDDRFRLLAGGRRRVHRQATLQATVDWSWDLLSEAERTLLARLGVFAGDFSLAAAEGICAGNGIDSARTVSLLASLIAKSLVVAATHDRSTRYRLLETIRIYAGERLVERGEAAAVRARHRDWYLSWVERLDTERLCHPWIRPVVDLLALEKEIDNLRAALAWSEQEERPELIGRMAAATDALWVRHGRYDEGLRWLHAASAAFPEDPLLEARCSAVDGWVTMQRGDFVKLPAKAEAALAAAERAGLLTGRRSEAIGALLLAGFCEAYGDRAEGRRLIDRARETAEALGLGDAALRARGLEGQLWLAEGRLDEASAALEALGRGMDPGRPRLFDHFLLTELVVAHHLAGRHEQAVGVTQNAAQGEESDPMFEVLSRGTSILARAGGGTPQPALLELLDLFGSAKRHSVPVTSHYVLTLVAAVLALRGDDEVASTVLSAARSQGEVPFRSPAHYAVYHHYGRLLRQRLGNEVARRCQEAGRGMSLDAAAALARRVAGLGGME
jgi:predicted ATPase/class 3 adenylate cyclase